MNTKIKRRNSYPPNIITAHPSNDMLSVPSTNYIPSYCCKERHVLYINLENIHMYHSKYPIIAFYQMHLVHF